MTSEVALAQRTGGTWQPSSLVFRGFLHQPLSDESVVSIATSLGTTRYESFATVGEIRVWWRADFQSGSRVLKKVF